MKKFILLIMIFSFPVFGQFESPKRELRGVWIATVSDIDWPYVQGTSLADINNQKNQLVNILNSHKSFGLNAVFFQVRTICDALYKSSYEPWSNYLTGTQGAAPSDTSYDPLKFAIDEAHKRGMELHAWVNPYRAELQNGSPVSANHIINQHPDWIIKCSSTEYRFLNPGLPEVRNYVTKIVMDIVRRYDVDGIHFDDYFYPYTEYGSFNDDATFAKYPNGFTDKAAWRKNNVDLLVKMIYDSIKVVKPWIKFGISPSGNPSVNGTIYVDPNAWLAGTYTDTTGKANTGEPYIDYILPQLYWEHYNYLGAWTSPSFLNGRHLYIGQAAYRFTEFSPGELSWEVAANRGTPTVSGSVLYNSNSVTRNLGNCNDTLEFRYNAHPALTPKMIWKDNGSNKPNVPTNIRFEINSSTGKYELHWDKPAPSANGDTAFVYVVYRSQSNPPDINDSTNIFGLTGLTYLSSDYAKYSVTKGNYYAVTAVDRYSNESGESGAAALDLQALIPGKPVLVSPENQSSNLGLSAALSWTGDSNSARYIVEISKDSTFNSGLDLLAGEYRDTKINFRSVVPGEKYYWRINAFGVVGESGYSDVYSFQSGIPIPPVLSLPAHATTDISLTPEFKWFPSENASAYKLQLSTTVQFYSNTFVIDTTVTDTTLKTSAPLLPSKIYYWRVSAKNNYGTSFWSNQFGFKTTASSSVETENLPAAYSLEQNYPNPFNPATEINFSIAKSGFVTLKVYDILGREIAVLINGNKTAGSYRIKFDASRLVSGIYIYRLSAGSVVISKKMIVLK